MQRMGDQFSLFSFTSLYKFIMLPRHQQPAVLFSWEANQVRLSNWHDYAKIATYHMDFQSLMNQLRSQFAIAVNMITFVVSVLYAHSFLLRL